MHEATREPSGPEVDEVMAPTRERAVPCLPTVTGESVVRARALLQLTQDELASIVGSNRYSVMRWEETAGPVNVTPAARRVLSVVVYQVDACHTEHDRRRLVVFVRRALKLGGEIAAYGLLHLTYVGLLPRLGRSIDRACGVEPSYAESDVEARAGRVRGTGPRADARPTRRADKAPRRGRRGEPR